ncbi:hypothetical protein [Pedobacter sp. JY14-1]|uniref:alpha/beta hydrolase n=1 Tax=Pedobacter sp. JY14-1 TaxID=3034151 RepID=UPI0023E165A4|nr:hypothetical protein [Pedobacter sp. JY14-1]
MEFKESTQSILTKNQEFTVTLLETEKPSCIGVFAAGRGGNPSRYLLLLRTLAEQGCTVIAPHFQMFESPLPTNEELDTRIRLLETVIEHYSYVHEKITGIGHSIGGTLLLTLAGGNALTYSGHQLRTQSIWRFDRLALMAPPVDFFLHPEALQAVNTQVYLRNGGTDTITPPSKALRLKEQFRNPSQIEFILDEQAGHFSYMNELPPGVKDTQPNRQDFLADLANDIAGYITS